MSTVPRTFDGRTSGLYTLTYTKGPCLSRALPVIQSDELWMDLDQPPPGVPGPANAQQ